MSASAPARNRCVLLYRKSAIVSLQKRNLCPSLVSYMRFSMNRSLIILTMIFFFASCEEVKMEQSFYLSGNLHVEKFISADGRLIKRIEYYDRSTKVEYRRDIRFHDFDSTFYLYDNGNIFKKGKVTFKNKPFGSWTYYDRTSNLREIREWFVLNNKSTINRNWYIAKNKDTIPYVENKNYFHQVEFATDTLPFNSSSYTIIKFNKDTISVTEPIRAFAYLGSPLLSNHSSETILFLAKDDNNYNSDFSNESKVKFDTFRNLTEDIANEKWFKNYNPKYTVAFGKWIKHKGKKVMRGYLLEYAKGNFENGIDSITHRTYFEKEIIIR